MQITMILMILLLIIIHIRISIYLSLYVYIYIYIYMHKHIHISLFLSLSIYIYIYIHIMNIVHPMLQTSRQSPMVFSILDFGTWSEFDSTKSTSFANFWFHLLKRIKFLPGFFIYSFSALCGPVVSSTGAHGFVHISYREPFGEKHNYDLASRVALPLRLDLFSGSIRLVKQQHAFNQRSILDQNCKHMMQIIEK